jgi:hypothetical protein
VSPQDLLDAVRQARQERDAAADRLYALRLRGAGRGEVGEQHKVVVEHERLVAAAIEGLYAQRAPRDLIESWSDDVPIVLLPLKVETRWRTRRTPPELWVRVFPDDIAVTTHEKVLTVAEVEHGQAYWTAVREAGGDDPWAALAKRFGANRAGWVALSTKPLNWAAAAADPALALDFPPVDITKRDAWTVAPHSRVMPDRFVLLGWRAGKLVLEQVGQRIDDVLVLGPGPLGDDESNPTITRDELDGTLALDGSLEWLRDFDLAVRRGMGFRARVTAEDIDAGFDQLVVLGLRASAGADDAKGLLEDLVDNHRWSQAGFALVPQGTPTNNTGGNDSAWSRAAGGPQGEPTAPHFTPVQDRSAATDGQRLAEHLGIGYEPLLSAEGAETADHAEAVAMNRALYAGTLGYYLDHMLEEAVDDAGLAAMRRHFVEHVTGRGPLPAIRVGGQPYGVLPTSSFPRWRPDGSDDRVMFRRLGGFDTALYAVLRRFDEAWTALVDDVPTAGVGDGPERLLAVLGLQPTSAELYQRVGYSYDYLKNLEAFAWGGDEFDDVLKMALEGLEARGLLGALGYEGQRSDRSTKPYPLLLQMIWRHYHTRLDAARLIDSKPLSETDRIAPFDVAGGQNYVDWLLGNARHADRLEAQDFGGAQRPTALLYMLLRFSLLMETARGAHVWLRDREVRAQMLVRSRKFMNIGPQPSPSIWEALRAPANSLVAAESTAQTLLEVLHMPQFAGDAGEALQEHLAGLDVLRALPTARLERALVEHIDTLGYRLDAWQTSLFARRLHRQRGLDAELDKRRTGAYLGAYGYLEGVRATPGRRERVPEERALPPELRDGTDLYVATEGGGFVHAPSLNHATAAAVLRNGYLTHATPGQPDALSVNLSSDRVRRAMSLLDGIRNGQSLEVLLGVQFERGLHDWTTRPIDPVILDDLKPQFRAAFPIRRTRVPQAAEAGAGASTVTEDHHVVNGLELARSGLAFPYGVTGLPALTAGQRAAIEHEKDRIADALDALRDVLTAESAYQLALGNFDRAAAIVRSLGDGTLPPDVEVVRTPRGTGLSFTNRLVVQLAPATVANPWPAVPLTERARLEPALNHWLGVALGKPGEVHCSVTVQAPAGTTIAGLPLTVSVSLAALGLQPIDLVSVVRSQADERGVAELEARVRYHVARAHGVPDDAIVTIAFGDGGAGERSFAEALALADRLRRLVGIATPLDGRHFHSPSKDEAGDPDNPGRIDVAELHGRVTARLAAVRALFGPLQTALATLRSTPSAAAADDVRDRLAAVAGAGFAFAVPRSAVGADAAQTEDLIAQADSVLQRAQELGPATDDQLAAAGVAGGPAAPKVALLGEAARAWLGGDFPLVPQFTFADPAAVGAAHAGRDDLLAHVRDTVGVPLPVDEWLHGAACVRPRVHDFEIVRAMAEAATGEPLDCSPLQLPYAAGDSWLGAEYPADTTVLHDTLAIVQHLPQGFAAAAAQCGLMLDEWIETVPMREEVTGLTFNFDAPNCAPPQAILLAVAPDETGAWSWDDLVDTVLDTFRRAQLRAVEPDAVWDVPAIGVLLPAVMAEFSTGQSTISLDFRLMLPIVDDLVTKLDARHQAAAGGGE